MQWPDEGTCVVRVSIPVGQVGGPLLFDEHAAPGRQLHQAADALVVNQRQQHFIGGRGHFNKDRPTVSVSVHTVEHQVVPVGIQVRSLTLKCAIVSGMARCALV